MIEQIRRQPTWPFRLSNKELSAAFWAADAAHFDGLEDAQAAYDESVETDAEYYAGLEAVRSAYDAEHPGIVRRLDVLGDEISRRERIGQWTEEDWMLDPRPQV